ncbi:Acyl carrier protein [Alteracholeplasma palmae J233]|uniref:Acyl carrier protein n=1 Tax=Alteracholeplasma palmae (strain ATCC 49389 / J233) TaxID=1318466 RepID=U4KK91_ALTPJ|nr:acyl carrier protein [Alteracholeplasma palmae]CCV63972.1 Acyl carrier protein [Alteracholeplasma palmae J233]
MPVFNKIKELIVNELSVDESKVALESRLVEDLGADSIDAVELVMNVEEAFNVEISDEALQNLKTVGDLVSFIETSR